MTSSKVDAETPLLAPVENKETTEPWYTRTKQLLREAVACSLKRRAKRIVIVTYIGLSDQRVPVIMKVICVNFLAMILIGACMNILPESTRLLLPIHFCLALLSMPEQVIKEAVQADEDYEEGVSDGLPRNFLAATLTALAYIIFPLCIWYTLEFWYHA